MKGVFKQNKELTFLKEEFKNFVDKKKKITNSPKEQIDSETVKKIILEEVEL